MGKIRDLLKKIRDTKGTFHAKMGSIKDRNSMDLTEAEDIKKRWQEYTEELYKKDLHNPEGVITHLEPDILECEVKWALESITTNNASGSDGISVELFQILKNDAVKVLHSIRQQIWKIQQWVQNWKRSVFIPIPKKGNAKECLNYHTITLMSHASKVTLKILQARLQKYVNRELPAVQAGFKKSRDTKEIFHAKIGSIKDRNGMDLTEAEDIKKRWQQYTEELYEKDLHVPDNHDGVITHLEPDILECEVQWALGSITNKGGGDRIQLSYFRS